MSNQEISTPQWQIAVSNAQDKFTEIARATGDIVTYQKEAIYAMQAIKKSDYLQKCHPGSIRDAVINVASVGLSLNPATGLAYLVPRDGAACLDISYRGLLKIATDSGSVAWAKAELVYKNDTFVHNGQGKMPTHKFDPFGERGALDGVYCVCKTADGDYLTEIMAIDEVENVRNTSKAPNSPAWKNWYGEMAKKSVIKRASKTWPRSERVAAAVGVLNEHEGLADIEGEVVIEEVETVDETQLSKLREFCDTIPMDERKICESFRIDCLESLPKDRYDNCLNRLNASFEAAKKIASNF